MSNPHIAYTDSVKARAGFTVLEMLIAAGIAAVLFIGGALLVTSGTRATDATTDTVRSTANLTTSTRFLHDDLRAARGASSGHAGNNSCATITTSSGTVEYCNTPAGATRSAGSGTTPLTRAGGHVLITRVGNQYRVEVLSSPTDPPSVFTVTSRLEAHRE